MVTAMSADPTLDGLLCECCQKEPAVGVASVPGVPMSIAWGRKCLDAAVLPYWVAVTNTALCNGLANTNEEWQGWVRRTLDYFERPDDEFAADVDRELRDLDALEVGEGYGEGH